MFETRREAGRQLAARLASRLAAWRMADTVVLGIARGGVIVADEVARALDAPLDVLLVQRLRTAGEPPVGIGALVVGNHPEVALDESAIVDHGVPADWVCEETHRALQAGRIREALLRAGERALTLRGRSVVLVDEGMATGETMRTAVRAVRRAEPARVIVAAPVASPAALRRLEPLVDAVVCLRIPRGFERVGTYYAEFGGVADGEVVALLAAARARGMLPAVAAR